MFLKKIGQYNLIIRRMFGNINNINYNKEVIFKKGFDLVFKNNF